MSFYHIKKGQTKTNINVSFIDNIRCSIPPNRQNPTIYNKNITNGHNPDSEKDKEQNLTIKTTIIWKMRIEGKKNYVNLGIGTDAIDLAQFKILNSEILLGCPKSKTLGSLHAPTIGRTPLNFQLGIKILLHCQHLSLSLSVSSELSTYSLSKPTFSLSI